jgi:hypothetical protein
MEVSGQLHAPGTLPREKAPRYPFHRIDWPQGRFGRCGIEKYLLFLPGIEPRPYTTFLLVA